MGGEFIGERRTDYVATKGERAPIRKPQDHLKPEGEFVGRPKQEAPTRGERAPVKKPQDNLRPEGEFIGKPREEAPKYGERAPVTKPRDTLKFEGDFDSKSRRIIRVSVNSFSSLRDILNSIRGFLAVLKCTF